MKLRGLLLAIVMVSVGVHAAETATVSSEGDLVEILESTQISNQAISPPSSEMYIAREEIPLPVDWSGFNKKFTKYMTATMDEYGLPRYHLLLWEDAFTRERVIALASTGFEVTRIQAPKDYLPETYYQNLLSSGGTYSEEMSWIFDPAHTAVEIELIPEIFYPAYDLYETEKAAQEATVAMESVPGFPVEGDENVTVSIALVSMDMASGLSEESELLETSMVMALSPPPPPGGGGTNSVPGGGGSSNLLVELAISLPEEGFGHMSHIEVFVKEDLIFSSSWAEGDSWIPTHGVDTVYWTDPASSNKMQRFYLVSDGADTDGDGHSDLYEAWVGSTDSNAFNTVNTDGDDLHDWLEMKIFGDLSQSGTNDFDSDGLLNNEELVCVSTNQPAIMLSDPALADSDDEGLNDYQERRVWFTDPMDPDTDDDGRNDASEVLGSPPTDPHNPDIVVPVVTLAGN